MKRIVVLIALAGLGAAAGAAAGLQLRPDDAEASCADPCPEETPAGVTNEEAADASSSVYIQLDNQFVVPIVFEERVASFVVISLSLEIEEGQEEIIYAHEPKLQDALLRVMFDHAYMGGFSGAFTESERMTAFRQALRETAGMVVGEALIDVLITELVRQEV